MNLFDDMATRSYNLRKLNDDKYELSIRKPTPTSELEKLSALAKNNNLALREEKDEIILFSQ